jgi:hypothetical protein
MESDAVRLAVTNQLTGIKSQPIDSMGDTNI